MFTSRVKSHHVRSCHHRVRSFDAPLSPRQPFVFPLPNYRIEYAIFFHPTNRESFFHLIIRIFIRKKQRESRIFISFSSTKRSPWYRDRRFRTFQHPFLTRSPIHLLTNIPSRLNYLKLDAVNRATSIRFFFFETQTRDSTGNIRDKIEFVSKDEIKKEEEI